MRVEVQIAGFGGQGVVLAGVILAESALRDGRQAVQSQSYGPEARGGAARSDVVLADQAVDHPRVLSPDLLVTMSQPAFDKYASSAAAPDDGGPLSIIDAGLVECDDARHHRATFTGIAEELGRKIVANMVMLGFVTGASDLVSRESILAAIEARVPKGTFELNHKAFELGFASGREIPGAPLALWQS